MATRFFVAVEVMAGVQQSPFCVLTRRSGVHEPSGCWCRSNIRNTLSRAPCHATQTRPSASAVATGLTSFAGLSEIRIGSDSLPAASQDRAQISKFANAWLGQPLFSDQKIQARPL